MMTAEPTEQEMEQMSPEELAKKKKEMLDFYTESITLFRSSTQI